MKYILTFLILISAFYAEAQINFGFSVSEGITQIHYHNFQSINIGIPNEGIHLFHGFKKHRISESIGIIYSPFIERNKITFTNLNGNITDIVKTVFLYNRISCPLQFWCNLSSSNSKKKLGFEGGVSGDFVFNFVGYQKGSEQSVNNVPVKGKGYYKVGSYTVNRFYYTGEFGIFSTTNSSKKYPVILNAGINYSKCFANQFWDFISGFFKAIVLFGK